jgi:hypothetical protein
MRPALEKSSKRQIRNKNPGFQLHKSCGLLHIVAPQLETITGRTSHLAVYSVIQFHDSLIQVVAWV